ncbi:MAG: hypothetical protein ABIL70_00600 [candidate division WOR-3 bacterium]
MKNVSFSKLGASNYRIIGLKVPVKDFRAIFCLWEKKRVRRDNTFTYEGKDILLISVLTGKM